MIRLWPTLQPHEIEAMLNSWAGEALKSAERAVRQRKKNWDDWVQRAFAENSASKVYRFMRGTEAPAAAVIYGKDFTLQQNTPDEVIAAKAQPWKELWCPEGSAFHAAAGPGRAYAPRAPPHVRSAEGPDEVVSLVHGRGCGPLAAQDDRPLA